MKFWITFNEENKIKDVRIGGIPEENSMEITQKVYEVIVTSPSNISWIKNGNNIEKIEIPPTPVFSYIPGSVTMRQARKVLLQKGLLTTVQNTISSMSEEAKIDWEFSREVQRNFPLVQHIKDILQLTEAQIDELFILASKLQ